MADIFYEDIETLIPNTNMKKMYYNGAFRTYNIRPNDGYALHDSGYDTVISDYVFDEETGEMVTIETPVLGYRTSMASCGYNYDFTSVEMQTDDGQTVTAYGSRRFFAKPISEVPENQIFGVTEPDHEIM